MTATTTRALVDAARAALARLEKLTYHTGYCNYFSTPGTCDCGLVATRDALRTALAAVAEEEDGGPRTQTQM